MFKFYDQVKANTKKSQEMIDQAVYSNLKSQDTDYQVNHRYEADLDKKLTVGDKEVTTKKLLMDTYAKSHVRYREGFEAVNLVRYDKVREYDAIIEESELTDEKIEMLRQYSEQNTGRAEKYRKSHTEKTNKYAKKLSSNAAKYEELANRVYEYRGRKTFLKGENFQEKEYAKLFKEKFDMDFKIIDDKYKLDKHAIKVGGNKDEAEKDMLLHIKYVNLASKLAVAQKAVSEAEAFPKYLNKSDYESVCKSLEKELAKLESRYSNEMLQNKAKAFGKATKDRAVEREEKRNALAMKAKKEEALAKYGSAFPEVREELLRDGDEAEKAWVKEVLTDDFIANAIASEGNAIEEIKAGNNGEFPNFKDAIAQLCKVQMYLSAINVPTTDARKLKKAGLQERDLSRTVKTQCRPARRFKNGKFVSEKDQENYEFNQKWIKALLENDGKARKECIEANLSYVKSFVPKFNQMDDPDYFVKEFDQIYMASKLNLGFANLKKDQFLKGATIQDNRDIYAEIMKNYEEPMVKTDLGDWDSLTMLSCFIEYIANSSWKKYKVNMKNAHIEVKGLAEDAEKLYADSIRTFLASKKEEL